ncbi:MAG TPA: TIGR02757 family protein [Tenuifilum sp.]|nr:TIGR02757 family protein [Tenuifilum sp.]HRS43781.1 TIGR02757 family protein [Tenuifilum sp.]
MLTPRSFAELADLLNNRYRRYACPAFIIGDPIQVPHGFSDKHDIEISALFAATFAWGSRKSIVNSASKLMGIMGNKPYEFVVNFSKADEHALQGFVHRTFSSADAIEFVYVLRHIYAHLGGLEQVFAKGYGQQQSVHGAIQAYRNVFMECEVPARTLRHVPNVAAGAAAKRINMFLRWMIRPATEGVDFGIWRTIPTSALLMPLDIHTGRVARKLGILQRAQDDFKAVIELTDALRQFDPADPVKYDYALFGLGLHEKF